MKNCGRKRCGRPIEGRALAVQRVEQGIGTDPDRFGAAGKKVYYCSMVCGAADLNELPVPKPFKGVKELP